MPYLKTKCPTCDKVFESAREIPLNGVTVHVGKCGHFIKSEALAHSSSILESLDGKRPFKFQNDTIDWMETNNGRCLVAHEMGLGKTICALGFLARHQDLLPVLFIVKKSLTVQWQYETMRWIGEDHFAQIISDSKMPMIPGCKYYIISYDLIPRIKDFKEQVEKRGIKTIVMDECQQIKNPEANRTKEVRNLCKGIEHVIALSGTPIKNNATEYFPVLNILHPEIFPRYSDFVAWWCDSYWDGRKYKSGGLRRPDQFNEKTKSFIIRKERKEVMPDLPTIDRRFNFHELSSQVEKAYGNEMRGFLDEYNDGDSNAFARESNLLAYITRMRRLTGLSKIDPCIDFTMEFLGSTDRKLTIFVHHNDVGAILIERLKSLMIELELEPPVQLTSELSQDQRSAVINDFMNGNARVLVASTLASGEGLNLQKCSDCIMLERQWNPANEEQAEGRFIRIGQLAESVTAYYFLAIGTIDEFFSEIVERKREIVNKTLGGQAVKWDQSSLMKELMETLAVKGEKRWNL